MQRSRQRLRGARTLAAVVRAYATARQSYADGARALGLAETNFPETQTNQFGYNVLQILKMPRLAVRVFEQNVRDYPKSPNVYDSLGDGLAAGDSSGARA